MAIYGVNTWAMSTYESRKSLIANYIRPLIGDMKLEDVSPRIMDKYYRDLLTVKAVSTKYVKARNEYLTPHTVREIHKVLRNAFNQAVKWELMTRNPVEHATLPKEEHKTRDIWTAEVLLKALEACDDDILRLAINLAFSCSLRMGELLGLTWDCVDISPASIELGQASIFVEKELQALLEGLGLSHLFSGNRKLTPEEKELWLLFDRVYVTELLARDEFAKGAYMLGAEDRETMLR